MVRSLVAISLMAAVACSTGEIGDAPSGNSHIVGPGPNDVDTARPPDGGAKTFDPNVPTFVTDVDPIIQDKCQNCHREGGIAPFSLITYEDVTAHALDARLKVNAREMPPWGAFDDDTCKLQHKLKDDLRLTDAQIATISNWVLGGMPLGDPNLLLPRRTTFPATSLADSTAFKLATPYKVQPGADDIRCFPIDPGLTEDTWVTGTNVVPGEPSVVHHVIVYLDPNKKGPAKAGAEGNYKCFGGPGLGEVGGNTLLLAWAPGVPPTGLGQNDAAVKIPKNSGLVMQVHYHPTNKTVTDQSRFELKKMAPGQKPAYVAQVQLLGNAKDAAGSNVGGRVKLLPGPNDPPEGPAFLIPSNAVGHTESMNVPIPALPIPVDLRVALAGAHMHWAGVDLKLSVERGAESEGQPKNECLVSTPKYDFNWQRGYQYDEPFEKLPKLTGGADTLHLECTYNNSASNKNVKKAMVEERSANPFELHLGETTHDEMCLAALVILRPFIPLYD